MPTRPATAIELETPVKTVLDETPLWERLMLEYLMIGEINGYEGDEGELTNENNC